MGEAGPLLLGVKSEGRSSARGVLRLRRCAGIVPLLLQGHGGAHADPAVLVWATAEGGASHCLGMRMRPCPPAVA